MVVWLFRANMTTIGIQNPKLIVPNYYQERERERCVK